MKQGMGSGSLPSKTFSILASSRPVLASVDKGSDTWNLIQASQAGLCIPPEDPGELARAILWFRDDSVRGSQMGRNGRTWIEKYHSPQAATNLFGNMFQEIIGNSKL
jgi:colanic acid biosynthesis glycosyl transferase WcaI